jgi:methylglutaconyl-CoA hydratase
VLSGAGKSFCAAPTSLDEWGFSEDENMRDAAAASRMFGALNTLPVPLIGRVPAQAWRRCVTSLSRRQYDLRVHRSRLGILPAVISPFVLEKIGRSAARGSTTGARFSSRRARELGLVHAVVARWTST